MMTIDVVQYGQDVVGLLLRKWCRTVEAEVCSLVGCLLVLRPSNMLVYLRDGPAQKGGRAASLR